MTFILQFEDNPRPPIMVGDKLVTSTFYYCGEPRTPENISDTRTVLKDWPKAAEALLAAGALVRMGAGLHTDNPKEATRFSEADATAVFNTMAYFELYGMKLLKKPVPPTP